MKKFIYDCYIAILNFVVPLIPVQNLRKLIYKIGKMKIGKNTTILRPVYLYAPSRIQIGDYCAINDHVVLDGRGKLIINDNVNISPYVKIYTAEHDVNSMDFHYTAGITTINKFAWVSTGSILLPGISVGEGAVIAAGAVVTKDINPYDIVGGVPAKVIGHRNKNLNYRPNFTKRWN
ncbi:maltose O-acetyltransferase [Sporolactobacillus nakayamae]|uniref:Maltose O-acetyltransferase n=1 Tax=Sporolactobacillus nakayamae TaxID=269670 RepID=A0A1I2W4B5_9BACL|nr:acyltransferase [Sporolactobacillus nakayamae]SFG96255.1 maltose O-acetyltransferase [Sporolactobacillus nakayamae]